MSRLCVLLFRENLHCEQQLLKLRFQLSLHVAMLRLSFFDPYFLLQLLLFSSYVLYQQQLPIASVLCVKRSRETRLKVIVRGFLDFRTNYFQV